MQAILQSVFDIKVTKVVRLTGYDNINYCAYGKKQKWILKTYTDLDQATVLEAESQALAFLAQEKSCTVNCPRPIQSTSGSYVVKQTIAGKPHLIRLLTFIDGQFLGDQPASQALYRSFGNRLANLSQALYKWSHPTIRLRQWEWHLSTYFLLKPKIELIENTRIQSVVRYFIQQYEATVAPVLPNLRTTTLYNDANEWNVLTDTNEVVGFIDFGDLAYGPLVNDVAIAMVYAAYDKEDLLAWACTVLSGFHQIQPLQEVEVKVLYHTMALRLCMSLCNSAVAKRQQPENQYAAISEQYAQNMLETWLAIGPIGAENAFRKAVGLRAISIPETTTVLNGRQQVISGALSVSYQQPIVMKQAAFQYMYAADGTSFLDAYNNIPHVGHHHPVVVEAAQKQLTKLNTNTRYLYPELQDYAETLLAHFPKPLDKVFFVNSGSEASDLAIRIAKNFTNRKGVVVMEHGYHGHTQVGIEISDYKFNHPKGIGQQPHIIKLPLPNSEQPTAESVQRAAKIIDSSDVQAAAFVSETILGCAGQVPLPEGYLKQLYPILRQKQTLCIADEVQTGFGRLGSCFWAFEKQEVVPDIVIIGKPMGNGHPMGAVVTTSAIADHFAQGVEFFSSFGGNPVSCAIGSAVLKVLKDEKLQENALYVGAYYKAQLKALQQLYPAFDEVRGEGLFLGVALVDAQKKPYTNLAKQIKNELRNQNILISTDGPFDSVLKSKPPLCFNKQNVDQVIDQLHKAFKKYPI